MTDGETSDPGTDDAAGGTDAADRPTILAVDDEPRVVEAMELWLDDEYRVLTATSGPEALELLPGEVDVILLDRHMPEMSGGEVLDRIREAGYDCRVAMVTAVDPDFDIVEMPFDHYVPKPVDGPELRSVVDRLLRLSEYDRQLNELYAVAQKRATLETTKNSAQLEDSDRYQALLDREAQLQSEVETFFASLDHAEIGDLFELVEDGE